MGIVWCIERRSRLLLATKPNIVRNGSQKIVARISTQDSTKSILEVVSPTSLETDAVYVKPCPPKEAAEPIHVTIDHTPSIVSEA
jgi:hypothetical protein